jgi:tetratricopeptide (TPR) repeat protein
VRAKAYAYLGNSHRILGSFVEAERAFQVAEHHLRGGVGGGRARAQVFSLKASLLIDQQRLVEAQALLDAVLAYHREAEDPPAIARIFLQRAIVAGHLGEWRRAIDEYDQARAQLDPARDEGLYALALQNSVEALIQAGELLEARRVFDQLPPPHERTVELRRLWIEGNLLRAEEAYGAARVAYDAARKGFAGDGNHYYAGLVSLDQAALALDRGDSVEAFEIAQEASVLLVRGAARQEPLAALRLLLSALEQGMADKTLVLSVARRIASYKPAR